VNAKSVQCSKERASEKLNVLLYKDKRVKYIILHNLNTITQMVR